MWVAVRIEYRLEPKGCLDTMSGQTGYAERCRYET